MEIKIKDFKGGSLSSTSLIQKNDNKFVRKSVSVVENREYGFRRWCSQLKRLQRYEILFPNLFPKILNYEKRYNFAFFDMEYFEQAVDASYFLYNSKNENDINDFFEDLLKIMKLMYINKMSSSKLSIDLYIYEEVLQKIEDCKKNKDFLDFLNNEYIFFNGERVLSFYSSIDEYIKMCKKYFNRTYEVFTHGNITLENMLYIHEDRRIILIDPYEENIIDSELIELSQILQSSNSKYEIYNKNIPIINSNDIEFKIEDNYGIELFNKKIIRYIKTHYNFEDYIMIRLFEISQFIRMLPFKMEIDLNKMYGFYGLASKLFNDLKVEINENNGDENE